MAVPAPAVPVAAEPAELACPTIPVLAESGVSEAAPGWASRGLSLLPLLVLRLVQLVLGLLDLLVLRLQDLLGLLYLVRGLLDQLELCAGERGLQTELGLSALSLP